MKAEIYHNISRDASFGLNAQFVSGTPDDPRSYRKVQATGDERHELVKVFEWDEPEPVGDVLDEAFQRFNVGRDELARTYRGRKLRSLSVGDVIFIDDGRDKWWSVESLGFKVRQLDELNIVADDAEAERLVRERYEFKPAEELTVTVPWGLRPRNWMDLALAATEDYWTEEWLGSQL